MSAPTSTSTSGKAPSKVATKAAANKPDSKVTEQANDKDSLPRKNNGVGAKGKGRRSASEVKSATPAAPSTPASASSAAGPSTAAATPAVSTPNSGSPPEFLANISAVAAPRRTAQIIEQDIQAEQQRLQRLQREKADMLIAYRQQADEMERQNELLREQFRQQAAENERMDEEASTYSYPDEEQPRSMMDREEGELVDNDVFYKTGDELMKAQQSGFTAYTKKHWSVWSSSERRSDFETASASIER